MPRRRFRFSDTLLGHVLDALAQRWWIVVVAGLLIGAALALAVLD